MTAPSDETAARRLPVVDVARGAALLAMFGYHLTWDLAHFGYIDARAPFAPEMRLFSHAIASSFLFIAGASLVLARRAPFAWAATWKRFALVAGAAALVTAGSWFLFPQAPILFGILHCIAAGSLLALPFLFLPWPAALAAAVLVGGLPFLVASPAFDPPWAQWTGLGASLPDAMDFRPLAPWAAPMLAGVAAMAVAVPHGGREVLARMSGVGRTARLLAFGGRHSLLIYLVHQPIFFGVLTAFVWAFPPSGPADEAPFRTSCERQCASSGAAADVCIAACACTARGLKRLNLWDKLGENRLDSGESALVSQLAGECVAQTTRN